MPPPCQRPHAAAAGSTATLQQPPPFSLNDQPCALVAAELQRSIRRLAAITVPTNCCPSVAALERELRSMRIHLRSLLALLALLVAGAVLAQGQGQSWFGIDAQDVTKEEADKL